MYHTIFFISVQANYDLILTVLLLYALIYFKDPQQYNHPPIYGGHVPSVQIKCRRTSTVCHTTSRDFM